MAGNERDDAPKALLPLLGARTWSIGFLVVAVVLAFVLARTMPDFFQAAYR